MLTGFPATQNRGLSSNQLEQWSSHGPVVVHWSALRPPSLSLSSICGVGGFNGPPESGSFGFRLRGNQEKNGDKANQALSGHKSLYGRG